MNKREKFWLKNLISFAILILIFIFLSLGNAILFNNSYMQEEKEELSIFQKQIEWAVLPALKDKNFSSIKKYCEDFKNSSVKIRIFDNDYNLISSSVDNSESIPIRLNSDMLPKNQTFGDFLKVLYNRSDIGLTTKIYAGTSPYYIELTVSEEEVLASIAKAQENLIFMFAILLIILLSGFYYIIRTMKFEFDEFQNSVVKVADGDLDSEIMVPSLGNLEEVALSVKNMAIRLKQQIEKLQQLERYKSDFIQNVSHEIKTPITALSSAVELLELKCKNLDGEDRECLEIIQFQLRVMNKLINDILCLSEIDAEKICDNKPFNRLCLNNVITEQISAMAVFPMEYNFINTEKVIMSGDENLISIAISNLLTNAAKYSQSPRTDIILNKKDKETELIIEDYGIGISKEHLGMIFEKFYRVDKARSREAGGSGLGLAIVKNIVELHNGTIKAESEEGKYTRFIITFPDITS